jgi:glycosyltransferase involved in cell wall biosynthesis
MDKPPVFFWQNMPAHHQTGALDALAAAWGAPVYGVWCSDIDARRKAQGWSPLERKHLKDIFLPQVGWRNEVEMLIAANSNAIHVFSGIGAYPPVTAALHQLRRHHSPKIALIVESPIMLGWRRWARWLKTRYHYMPCRRQIGAVFAMGIMGVRFYRGLGFRDEQLFPFMYQEDLFACKPTTTPEVVRIIYAGQLSRRKGADILLAALAQVPPADWTLDIFGDGPERAELERMAALFGLSDKVRFRGIIQSAQLMVEIRQHDLCIVPSRFDGWGMVTNEALQSSVPVIVSDRAGSADLVRASTAGAVFPAEDALALARLIKERLGNRKLLETEKQAAHHYAHKITPQVVGAYLAASLEHTFVSPTTKPKPTWMNCDESR